MTDGERMIMRLLGQIEGRMKRAEAALHEHSVALGQLLTAAATAESEIKRRVGTSKRRAARAAFALAAVGAVAAAAQAIVLVLHS